VNRTPARERLTMALPPLCALAIGCATSVSLERDNGAADRPADAGRGTENGSGGSGVGGIGVPDGPASDGALTPDAACAGSVSEARLVPLDLFIMLDRSASMAMRVGPGTETRWSAVKSAIAGFVNQPEAAGIGIGVGYFGPSQDVIFGGQMCNSSTYSRAEVPIASLPQNAQPILDSLARNEPTSTTPTSAALQGSTDFCRGWAMSHPEHVVVNVFATDGEPADCDQNPANILQIASGAYGGLPSIRTFAIGVGNDWTGDGGPGRRLLDGIASAGGTRQAFVVSDADLVRQFLDALNRIRSTSLGCEYSIPDTMGRQPDYRRVNVWFTPRGSSPMLVPKVASSTDCGSRDGWHYDDDAKPTRILVCDATCRKLSGAVAARVEIQIGCETIIAPPPA
jgi:hypothetical protein